MKKAKQVLSILLAVIMLVAAVPVMNVGAASFTPRLTAPERTGYYGTQNSYNPFWTNSDAGNGNCTWYAWGRAYELLGSRPQLSTGNANTWYPRNIANGTYPYGSTPKLGAIACWATGSAGHVAVVEAINDNGTITISESSWNATTWWFRTNTISSNCSYYSNFQGFIYINDFSLGHNPIGDVNDCSGGKGCVYVKGWVFDEDGISESSYIHVYIGGNIGTGEGHAILANKSRKDVDGTYHCGEFHGFEETIGTRLTGSQKVYIYGINVGGGENVLLGEYTVTIEQVYDPCGDIDGCYGGNGYIWIKGWVFDWDKITDSLYIHVYIGEGDTREGYALLANASRKDVDNAHHCGEFHGFEETIVTQLRGEQRVCIWGINVGGGANKLLYDGRVNILPPNNPLGDVNHCLGGEGCISIRGWAFDQDNLLEQLNIHVYIGEGENQEAYGTIVANKDRTDVDDYYHCGQYHGFDETIATKLTGNQKVAIWAINYWLGDNVLLWEGTVNIQSHSHSYVPSVTKAATCIAAGVETFTCSCGDSYTKPIAINPNNHVNTTNVAATASTCTVKGYSAGVYCNDCKQYISGHDEQPLAAHQTTVINAREATYDADGYTGDTYCTVCKQTLSYGSSIPKLTKPNEPTNPTSPTQHATQPATQQQQQQSGNCKYCGGTHSGFPGILIGFFHSILAMFGLRK